MKKVASKVFDVALGATTILWVVAGTWSLGSLLVYFSWNWAVSPITGLARITFFPESYAVVLTGVCLTLWIGVVRPK